MELSVENAGCYRDSKGPAETVLPSRLDPPLTLQVLPHRTENMGSTAQISQGPGAGDLHPYQQWLEVTMYTKPGPIPKVESVSCPVAATALCLNSVVFRVSI